MIRIILLFIVFVKGKDAISQHTFITRVENTSLVQWAENRLKVLVEGRMCGEIVVKASRGQILMDANNCEIIYTAPDTSIHRTIIKIGVKQKNGVSWLQEIELPAFRYP